MARLRLKAVLEERNMTMAKLSRLADLNYITVRDLVRFPERDVNLSTLNKIAEALGVPVSALLEEEIQPPEG